MQLYSLDFFFAQEKKTTDFNNPFSCKMYIMCSAAKKFHNTYLYLVNKMIDILFVLCKSLQTLGLPDGWATAELLLS